MNRTPLYPLLRIILQLKEYYPIVLIYSIVISLLTLATPISVQSLVNTFSFGPYFQPIFILSVILLGLLTVLGIVKSLQYLLVEFLQRKLYAKVTASIGRAYYMGDERNCDTIDKKDNRYFDVILVYKNLSFLVTDGIALALQTALGLLLLAFYHPYFIVFGLLIILSIIGPIYFFGFSALESAVQESTEKYNVADHLRKIASHKEAGKPFEGRIAETDSYIERFITHRSAHFRTLFLQNIIYIALYAILNALLLALGGYLVIKNQLTVGQLVAAEIVVNAILGNFLYAKKYLEAFYDMYAASKKIHVFFEFIDNNKAKTLAEETNSSSVFARRPSDYHKDFQSVEMIYSPKNYTKIFRNFSIGMGVVLLLLLITPWQQFSRGYGKVLAYNPNDRVQNITAPLSGVVEEWLVQDGQFVNKGDSIVRVVDNDPNYLVRLEAARDAAVAKFEAAKEASDTGRLNFHRQEKLVKEGLSSPKEFEQAKIKYKKLRAEEAAAAASLAKAEVNLSRQQQQVIVAPRDGKILRILSGSGTTIVKKGDPLVEFVPQTDDHAVELFIDGNDLPLVYEGRLVRLQFEGWPAVQFSGWPSVAVGSFGGVVSVVDPSVQGDGTFRILIKPDPNDSEEWPDQKILRQGARAVGIVLLDEVSVGYELWRQINGFPKSMPDMRKQTPDKKAKK